MMFNITNKILHNNLFGNQLIFVCQNRGISTIFEQITFNKHSTKHEHPTSNSHLRQAQKRWWQASEAP
jgi:hypothetical protein